MEEIRLQFLEQTEDYELPFPYSDGGFNKDRWHRIGDEVGNRYLEESHYIQLIVDNDEIGRAEVSECEGLPKYVGVNAKTRFKEILFFEIHEKARRQGYGAKFASMLCAHYAGIPMVAFSEGADQFWDGIGWTYFPCQDRDVDLCSKLFISGL